MTAQQPEQPMDIGVRPLPGQAQWQCAGTPDGKFVIVQVTDAAGVTVRFLDPDTALVVADHLRKAARTAKSVGNGAGRLILPPGAFDGIVGPDGAPS